MTFVVTIVWILAGAAISAGVYWAFLTTPESTVWALITSALLGLIALILTAFTITGAIAILSNGLSRTAIMRALRAIPSIVPALLIVSLIWWLTLGVETWVGMRSGQINAWFIAQFGWADVSWLFRSIRYTAMWLRWILASMLAFSLMTGFVLAGSRALTQLAWLRRALRPRALVFCSLIFVVLIALPWKYLVPWRPAGLPATSIELVFITAKLALAAVIGAIAIAMMIREASGAVPPPRDPKEAAQAA
jgi:hypothetical protein